MLTRAPARAGARASRQARNYPRATARGSFLKPREGRKFGPGATMSRAAL